MTKRWTALLPLLACLVSACGRVGYQSVQVAQDAAWPDQSSLPDAREARADDGVIPDGPGAEGPGEVPERDGPSDDRPGPDGPAPEAAPDRAEAPGPEVPVTDVAVDTAPPTALFLRYDFGGTGTVVADRVGTANGRVLGGAQLDGRGGLTLDGIDDHVDLPNGLLSGLTSVTVVVWLQWAGGICWQRVFDFGSSSNGEGNPGNATSALALSPSSCPGNTLTGLFELDSTLRLASSTTTVSSGVQIQLALAVDGARSTMIVYLNGAPVGQVTLTSPLSALRDVNNWLGRSQWAQDNNLRGRLDELRIYSRALSARELAALHARGPDSP
jgi:hypothetical protein